MDHRFLKGQELSLFKLLHSFPLLGTDQHEPGACWAQGMEKERPSGVPAFVDLAEPCAVCPLGTSWHPCMETFQ